MTSKEFIERLKNNDLIYETDENSNVVITKTAGEIFENHFKKLEKDLEILEKYKSIEEELGIDLIKVLKAIKQAYIYKKLDDGSIVKVDVDMLNFEEGLRCGIFSKTYSEGNYKQCYKMDTYLSSETWTLTKEE